MQKKEIEGLNMKFKYIFLSLFFGVLFLAIGSITVAFIFPGLFFLVLGTILIVFQLDKAYSEKK